MRGREGLRPCLNQSCFSGLMVTQFLDVASRADVRSVELRTLDPAEPVAPMRAAVQAAGIRIEAVNCLMDWALPDDPDPKPELERLLEMARAVGAPIIVCVAPIRTAELPRSERIVESAAERLADLTALAKNAGVRLAFEQVGESSSRPGAQSGIKRLADARTVVEAAGPEALLAIDSYNLATAGEGYDLVRSIPGERIGIVHFIDRNAGQGGRTLPGDGNLPLDRFISALVETGYEGAISLEMFPTNPWPDPVAFARRAVERVGEYV